ncbi:DUF6641 family protein [Candidatus Ferrigenium straubiae]|uniref:DUF6641 family protein n=1 Tax=Candidatus Ferrigenium straubiae TaxID=2919506 RepID=UPI003F4AA5D1
MTFLDKLKVVTAVKSNKLPPALHRQIRVIEKLREQIECVKAKTDGREYIIKRMRTVKSETGEKTQAEHNHKIRPWWYRNADGKLVFEVRYANKRLELAKGKTGIEVENLATLIPAIELLMKAVESGELDKSLSTVATSIRSELSK